MSLKRRSRLKNKKANGKWNRKNNNDFIFKENYFYMNII